MWRLHMGHAVTSKFECVEHWRPLCWLCLLLLVSVPISQTSQCMLLCCAMLWVQDVGRVDRRWASMNWYDLGELVVNR